ncbi:BTAD domain-containing putative transcriptional regulator [Pseudonocardia ailaonensis]|uniref:BTAD domain-containing putative transcriptional regulator n=1 Tax=Pseudonocardia ailaonensis TaxID=367279 RepID=A0ABN2NG95_9PSEU
MLSVDVLGRVVVRRDGVPVPVPTGLTTDLLVRLALDAGTPVRVDRLLADLWPDEPGVRPNTLQAKVSQLRRALGDAALVPGGAEGYRLAEATVDAHEARRLEDEGTALLAAGDRTGAAAACRAGAALFGPEILAGVQGSWAEPYRAALQEVRLRLAEDGATARLALGEAAELVGELEALVAAHPLREGLWTALVTALYRAGRQADALAAHRRVTALLADELGVDPGPALAELGRRMLQQDPVLAPVARRVGNLPALGTPLVGRQAELAELGADLRAHRLVTLVGPAGVGKTRLALEAARAEPVAWLVRLEGARTADGIAAAVADVVPGVEAADPAAGLLGVEALLVLDTCEHLVETIAALATTLLDAAPGVRILATSRQPLGIDGEEVRPVEPLPVADAVALFAARARPGSEEGVAELCRALDCLPLAVELAAARTRVLTVPEIAARLDDRFALLADPRRRRTLAAALAWSYDLLFPDDQRGLWALAGFPDGAPPAAVEHVLRELGVPPAAALDVVDRLVDRSLAVVGTDRTGATRYRLLDSVRIFASDRTEAPDTVGDAVVTWVAELATEVSARVRGPGQADAVARTAAERATIDAALDRAHDRHPELGLRIAVGFAWAWVLLDDSGAAARLRRARLAAPGAPAGLRDRALLLESWLEAMSGDLRAARLALDAAGDGPDRLWHSGFVLSQEERHAEALAALGAARAAYAGRGLAWEETASVLLTVFPHLGLGDVAAARVACEEAVALLGPVGDAWGRLHAESALGRIAQAEGRPSEAAAHHERAAESAAALGFPGAAALHRVHLGRARHAAGDPAAETTLREATAAAEQTGDHRLLAEARVRLAEVLLAGPDPDHAEIRALLTAADRWFTLAGPGDGADEVAPLLERLTGGSSPADPR